MTLPPSLPHHAPFATYAVRCPSSIDGIGHALRQSYGRGTGLTADMLESIRRLDAIRH
ncbi:hypothetical protein [Sphingomonas sp. CFBP 13720]|uniref:hypothetical protein n=1 Tax=Sphingomonas sp. CFBP 13720 TaxID=2775302 RepID=UPI00177A8986|nr:hypothetical protein [Sphingomonas sp. CFBP 13720]MBD8677329.1 hypothetical protein [Sphingomonas sp. CFBP 13720]